MEESEKEFLFVEMKNNLPDYVVKPMKEGGSNNYYGNDILDVITKPEVIDTSIVQAKIFPPENDAYILREGKLTKEKSIYSFSFSHIINPYPSTK